MLQSLQVDYLTSMTHMPPFASGPNGTRIHCYVHRSKSEQPATAIELSHRLWEKDWHWILHFGCWGVFHFLRCSCFFLVLAHALTTFDQMEWLIETLVNVSNPNCKNYCRRHDHDHDDDDHHPTLFLPNQMPFSSPTNLSIQAWPLLHGSEFPKRRRSSFGIKEDDMLSHSSGFLRLKYSSGQIIATSLQKLAEEGKSLISDKIHEQNLYYIQSPDFQKTSGGFVIFQLDLLLVREKDPAN